MAPAPEVLHPGDDAGVRARLAHRVDSPAVQRLIVALILFNAITLGLETFPAIVRSTGPWLQWIDQALLAVFVIELLLKLLAHGWRFFRSAWNLFDFVVVGIALLPATGALSVLRAEVAALRRLLEGRAGPPPERLRDAAGAPRHP